MEDRARQHEALPALFEEILRARAALRTARHLGEPAAVARDKERRLHKALNNYAAALSALRLPVPCVIRDELRIYRDLLATHGDWRPRPRR